MKRSGRPFHRGEPSPGVPQCGPGMLESGVKFKDLPFIKTTGDAFAVVSAINEADNYREATGQISPRPQNLHEDFSEDYNNFSEFGNVMQYYLGHDISNLQPQSVQVFAQPASTSVAPEQTINFNIQNDFNGNWQDRRGFEDIGEYLARQVKNRLNSGAPLFSGN